MSARRRWSIPVLLLAMSAGCAKLGPPGDRPSAAGLAYRDVSPRWSPNGAKIAFIRVFGNRLTQLWVCDADLRNPRALTEIDSTRWARPPIVGRTAPVPPDAPSWSPDGRRIAVSRAEQIPFERDQTIGGTGIWAFDVDTGQGEPVAVHPAKYNGSLQFYRAPAWSPDGRRIAYLAEGVFGKSSLVMHTLGVSDPREISPFIAALSDDGWPAWSPDGRWLAYRQSLYQSESALPIEAIRLIAPGTTRSRTIFLKSPKPIELWRASHLTWVLDPPVIAARMHISGGDLAWLAGFNASTLLPLPSRRDQPTLSALWNNPYKADEEPLELRRLNRGFIIYGGKPYWDGFVVPTDDLDISPDGHHVVFCDRKRKGPAALTTLQVLGRTTHHGGD